MYPLFGKSTLVLANTDMENGQAVDQNGSFSRMPTVEEFAIAKDINVNTEIDTSKLGKVGTISELDEDDEDGVNGSGSFLWSFN